MFTKPSSASFSPHRPFSNSLQLSWLFPIPLARFGGCSFVILPLEYKLHEIRNLGYLVHFFYLRPFIKITVFVEILLTCSTVYGEGNGNPLQYACLENPMDGGAWWAAVHGVTKSRTRLSDFTFTFHCHALEKEMASHSSVLAWRIRGTAEPGGLPSMGSYRVGHD